MKTVRVVLGVGESLTSQEKKMMDLGKWEFKGNHRIARENKTGILSRES